MNLHYSQTLLGWIWNCCGSYTSMNLHYSQTVMWNVVRTVCLIPLWIYITLKRWSNNKNRWCSLIPLWIYITLKHLVFKVWTCMLSYTSMNLHYSQTTAVAWLSRYLSYTSMNLHYSQTPLIFARLFICLIPLWIYITLKPCRSFISRLSVLYLYEFTLLSNLNRCHTRYCLVLYLYEFTLLSNNWL